MNFAFLSLLDILAFGILFYFGLPGFVFNFSILSILFDSSNIFSIDSSSMIHCSFVLSHKFYLTFWIVFLRGIGHEICSPFLKSLFICSNSVTYSFAFLLGLVRDWKLIFLFLGRIFVGIRLFLWCYLGLVLGFYMGEYRLISQLSYMMLIYRWQIWFHFYASCYYLF